MILNLNNIQRKAIVISANTTATTDSIYTVVANATFTDPSPIEGKGFKVFVRNGTAVIGGTSYTLGSEIVRIFHSGAWANYRLDATNKQDTLTDVNFGTFSNGLTSKTTPIDADTLNISDSADSNKAKKLSFTNLKAFLKTYFDTIYTTTSAVASQITTALSSLTTASISDSTNKRYVTDAQLTVIGNTSNTNTGDETQSSILSKLGWFVYNRVSESTAVTGTTTEAIIENIKINANTFVSGGILRSYNNKFRKVGTAGSLTVRLYISPNNNSLTGANQIAIASIPAANLFAELLRTFTATTTSLIGWNSAVSTTNDVTISTSARTETAVTWANDQYFIITVQLANAGDSVSLIGASLKNF